MGGVGSGGPNGGPQYNPANVSGTGGAGQNGDYTGFAYGQNQAVNQQRVEGNQAVASAQAASPAPATDYSGISMSPIGTLLDPSNNPSEPITAGSDFGPGVGSSALPSNLRSDSRPDENAAVVAQYLPDLALAAQSANAPDSFKRFVNYLASLNG